MATAPATLLHNKRAKWLGDRYQQALNAFNQHDNETFETIYESTLQNLNTAFRSAQQLTLPLREAKTRKPITLTQTKLFDA